MRVLLLADSCNPSWSSTPFFGYQICRAIGRHAEVTLATHVRNREGLRGRELGGARVVYLDTEYIARPVFLLSRFLRGGEEKAQTLNVAMSLPSYIAFEYEVWKRFGGELRRGDFDVVHRVTPLSPTVPSPMASWSPVPFVIGPVNGGLRWPKAFGAELRREREWMTYLRALHKLAPYYLSTYRRAAAVLAGFGHTRADLPLRRYDRVFDCPDVGVELDGSPLRREVAEAGTPMTVLFVGRLVPYKCPEVVVEAFAREPELRRCRLLVVGDGPERPRLERIIAENGLQECVELLGWQSHEEVMRLMRKADVFAFPSVRELGAGVVVEAMGGGMTCVVVDYGGPGAYIDGSNGVKLPLVDKPTLVRDMGRALAELAMDPERRRRMGAAAAEYVRMRHTWDAKARRIVQVYEWVLGQRAERPSFYAPI